MADPTPTGKKKIKAESWEQIPERQKFSSRMAFHQQTPFYNPVGDEQFMSFVIVIVIVTFLLIFSSVNFYLWVIYKQWLKKNFIRFLNHVGRGNNVIFVGSGSDWEVAVFW